jgi:hypothetical protein
VFLRTAQIESALQELSSKIERSAAAVAAKVGEGEASVHRQAKADHAKTCQVRSTRHHRLGSLDGAGSVMTRAVSPMLLVAGRLFVRGFDWCSSSGRQLAA